MKNYPNIILIAGNGRNVGKTLLSCRIINHLASLTEVYAVKISSHFHELDKQAQIIIRTKDYCIVKETLKTRKDSSRMLDAGATDVYYVQCKNENLSQMFEHLQGFLPNDKPIVIESGGLYNYIVPHVLYYIKGEDSLKKHVIRDGDDKIVLSPDEATKLDVQDVFPSTPND
ncbi:hypothetical protein [Carboxylicivirga marina]|uniref:MobA-like NTP transferase domain-containing protein n=1 Tax=Carboxylicivirga marina TaxID=2800988 RepID=A0ABS1HNL2_9BACT|nr:hypothetical protein [Carboxylicivirga marina]MBK3519280.1 hypothetical protein [Carboxylicivirga marina]